MSSLTSTFATGQHRLHGLIGWAYDPAVSAGSGTALTSGQPVTVKIPLSGTHTITNLLCFIATAGTSLTSGQNFGALYDSSGTLLAQTADATTAFGGTGLKTLALTTPQTVTGDVFAMFWFNGSGTALALSRASAYAAALANANITSPGLGVRFGQVTGGVTTTAPTGPISPSSIFASYWAAVS